jgi:peroxiredoxin Q/BCP
LRDNVALLRKHNIEVIGISPDDEASHLKFSSKQKLPYSILSDTALKACNDYGVWGEKSMYGNKYMGVIRTTFLIDEKGKIAHIIEKVKSSEHSNQIIKLWKDSI